MTQAFSCREIDELIGRETHGFSQAERLRMEQHVTSCADCRESLALARFVRGTLEDAPYALSDAARSRALSRALTSADKPISVRPQPRLRAVAWAVGAVAAAAALAWFAQGALAPERLAQAPKVSTPIMARPGPQPAPTPAEPDVIAPASPTPMWVEASAPMRRSFAHAQVELAPATRVRFDAAERSLFLERGRVDVDVDVTRGQTFSVATQHFRVVVLGTRFTVTPDAVTVQRGRVEVQDQSGKQLRPALGAGDAFNYARESAKRTPEAPAATAKVWLTRAREVLATGDTLRAKEFVTRAEHSAPQRLDRAEAATLRAEAALLERDPQSALRLYLSVSTKFADLTAGENAAFAATQLAARNQPAQERTLLTRYLARYPQGRFAAEVKARLSKLPAP
jgi:ferric-dicitrate binding protein FerR (iron transport regulator)